MLKHISCSHWRLIAAVFPFANKGMRLVRIITSLRLTLLQELIYTKFVFDLKKMSNRMNVSPVTGTVGPSPSSQAILEMCSVAKC
jgi:hypothetical protein